MGTSWPSPPRHRRRTIERALLRTRLRAVHVDAGTPAGVSAAYATASDVARMMARGLVPHAALVADGEARTTGAIVAMLRDHAGRLPDVLAPLRAARGDYLLETVEAYLRTGNAVSAAAALGVHPQTLRHRLRRVRERSGLDPDRAWDRYVLETALAVRRLT